MAQAKAKRDGNDKVRELVPGKNCMMMMLAIPMDLWEKIKAAADREGSEPGMVIVQALQERIGEEL